MPVDLKCRICGAKLSYRVKMITPEQIRSAMIIDEAISAAKEGRKRRKIPLGLINESYTAYMHEFICSKNDNHKALITTVGNNREKAIRAYNGMDYTDLKER